MELSGSLTLLSRYDSLCYKPSTNIWKCPCLPCRMKIQCSSRRTKKKGVLEIGQGQMRYSKIDGDDHKVKFYEGPNYHDLMVLLDYLKQSSDELLDTETQPLLGDLGHCSLRDCDQFVVRRICRLSGYFHINTCLGVLYGELRLLFPSQACYTWKLVWSKAALGFIHKKGISAI